MPITGSSPDKTYTRSDGTRTGSAVCVQERDVAGLNNTAELADARENDFATALNVMLMKDGGNKATANIPMNGYKFTGLGTGSTTGDSVTYEQMNAAIAGLIGSGTSMVFFQAAAPTGWTQNTTYNDCALRIVSGTGGGAKTNGQAFSTAVASGTVDGHAVTTAEMPVHSHGVTDPGHAHTYSGVVATAGLAGGVNFGTSTLTGSTATTGITIQNAGSGAAHTHTFTSSAFGLNYINAIVCTRN